MGPAIFLLGSALVGLGLIRRALGTRLSHAEQALSGLVLGWALTTAIAYVLARAMGRLSAAAMLALSGAILLVAVLLWWRTLRRIARGQLATLLRNGWTEHRLLVIVLCCFAPVYLFLFQSHMLRPGEGGAIYSGGSAWYDMGLHAAITTSFLHGANFPPVYTAMPPEPLLYPFLPDFQTSLLMVLGMDMHTALVSTAVPLALALTGIFFLFARRLLALADTGKTAMANESGAAALATVLFFLNGGLGFLYFFREWRATGKTLAQFLSPLEVNFANMPGERIVWTNLITDMLLPQRTSLFGIPLALFVFLLFAMAWREGSERGGKTKWAGWRILLAAGTIAGLLPYFHVHSFAAVGLISGFLFILRPRRVWLVFWLPALVLALPRFVALGGHLAAAGIIRIQPGWRGHSESNWIAFWVRNVGLPALLIVPAWLAAPLPLRRFYVAFVALLVFSLLVVLSPNDYDNIKLIYFWYAATAVLLAAWLVRLAAARRWLVPVLFFVAISIASGALALLHEFQNRKLMYTRDELAAASFVREQTAPRSLFLTAPSIHQPILSLAGRAIVRGDTAWLWSHGYSFAEREADVRAIYAGRDDALELLRYYRVDYVYLGPRERRELKANREFFENTLPVFYRSGGIVIYDARQLSDVAANDAQRFFAPYPHREYSSRLQRDPYQPLVEFQSIGFALYRYERARFGRAPHHHEFMDDLRVLGRGVYPGASSGRDVLESNKRSLLESWTARPDFKERYEALSDEAFVQALYANAGLPLADNTRAALSSALSTKRETKASLLRGIADDSRLAAREYNAAYVLLHYFGYLQRDPDQLPDRDLAGYNFWLNDLNRTGDYRSLTRVFIESGEYKDRKP